MLYFAYGSNLCVQHMRRRCPAAKPVMEADGTRKQLFVQDAALVFRGVADVTTRKGEDNVVPGGVWRLTPDCERALDRFEGVSVQHRGYLKRYFKLADGKTCLFYQMKTHRGIMPPDQEYLDLIRQGYEDFGLDLDYLQKALDESWRTKRLTRYLIERHIRRGQPKLAKFLVA